MIKNIFRCIVIVVKATQLMSGGAGQTQPDAVAIRNIPLRRVLYLYINWLN